MYMSCMKLLESSSPSTQSHAPFYTPQPFAGLELTVHLLGLSPVCTLMCISNLYLALKGLWSRLQSLQKQVKSSPLRWSMWFLSTCFTRSSLLSHILSQSIHWHCVTFKIKKNLLPIFRHGLGKHSETKLAWTLFTILTIHHSGC